MEVDKERKLPKRVPVRLQHFDYSTAGAYFITVCTEGRRQILSCIAEDFASTNGIARQSVGGDVPDAPQGMQLLPYGEIAQKYIEQLSDFYDNVEVNNYVIMPNHIHLMLIVRENGASRTSPPTRQHATVSRFVSTLKRFCNKEYEKNIWQRHFHDHIIRNREDYEKHIKYICENPMRWHFDELYAEE